MVLDVPFLAGSGFCLDLVSLVLAASVFVFVVTVAVVVSIVIVLVIVTVVDMKYMKNCCT